MNDFKIGDNAVGTLLSASPTRTPTTIITESVDGSMLFAQTVGNPKTVVSVALYVPTNADKLAVENAAYLAAKVSVNYLGIDYVGFIDGAITWSWISVGKTALAKFDVRAVVV